MGDNYTTRKQSSIMEYTFINVIEEAVDYLKNPESFRSFGKGLAELLKRKGYSGDFENAAEMTEYLMEKLDKIGTSITKQTLRSWLSGKTSPKVEAANRAKMYEICFSLGLNYQETVWFFQHVYYDRAFNCHTIEEAVFYYAFLNGIPYLEARKIIEEIEAAPAVVADNNIEPNYTLFVRRRISQFCTDDELKEFLIANKDNFRTWNISASRTLHDLHSILLGSPEMKKRIEDLKRQLNKQIERKTNHSMQIGSEANRNKQKLYQVGGEMYQDCGLLMKEIFYDAEYPDGEYGDMGMIPAELIMELIEKRNTNSNNFLLERLLTTSSGIQNNIEIPYIVKNNFPSRKVISDILSEEKISVSKSYDSIRKMIILLDFYRFWLSVKLKIGYTDLTKEELVETYCEEADSCLYGCGYEGLYQGNPYDWIFLSSAHSEAPLSYLRAYIAELDDADASVIDDKS